MNRYFFAVLLLTAMIAPAAAQSLTAGYISKDLNYLPFFIALKKGFYAKEGCRSSASAEAIFNSRRWSPASCISPTSTPTTSSSGTKGPTAI